MKPMNILLKGFERHFGPRILERAFQGVPIGFCASILNDERDMPNLHAAKHVWYPATDLRMEDMATIGYNVDWNTIRPLDEKLIKDMRECETVVLDLFVRFERKRRISYEERKRAYLQHLRYWNHIIEEESIHLFLSSHVPHQCFDNVIDALCKRKGIPTLYFYPSCVPDELICMNDWEEAAMGLKERYEELVQQFAGKSLEAIDLPPRLQKYFDEQTSGDGLKQPFYMDMFLPHPAAWPLKEWVSRAWRVLRTQPLLIVRKITSPDFWSQKLRQRDAYRFYESHVSKPDLSKKFIYVALHVQPECSTAPMAGAFVNQELIVQLLSAHVPDDVLIYVKEHPHQSESCRSAEFYKDLLSAKNVRFVPRTMSSAHLVEHAQVVVTATGTVGIEALLRQKPVFIFGHRFYQYAPGVFPIHTEEDCHNAFQAVFVRGEKPNLRDVKLFFKAYGDKTVEGYFNPYYEKVSNISEEENIRNIGDFLAEQIRAIEK